MLALIIWTADPSTGIVLAEAHRHLMAATLYDNKCFSKVQSVILVGHRVELVARFGLNNEALNQFRLF